MTLLKKLFLLFSPLVLLTGCATDNTPKPSPLVEFKPTRTLSEQWESSFGRGANGKFLRLPASVMQHTVYTANATGDLFAYDTHTGDRLWKTRTGLPFSTGPSTGNGSVFIGTLDAQVVAYAATTGKEQWRQTASSEILATPTPTGDILLVKTIDGKLQAYNQQTGAPLWTYTQQVPSLILRGASPAAHTQTLAIAGFANGKLAGVTLTGSQAWIQAIATPQGSNPIANMVDIDVMPIINKEIVFVATYQGNLAAIHIKTGNILWSHTFSSYSGIAIDDTHIYATDAEGFVWAFDQNTGSILWVNKSLQYRVLTGPAVFNNAVVVADQEGYLHALAISDGHFLARTKVNKSGILATPTVSDNLLFVTTLNGSLLAYQLI